MNELENRVCELEEQNAYMQKELDEFNEILTKLNLEQLTLIKRINSITAKFDQMAEATQSQSSHNPHLGANR